MRILLTYIKNHFLQYFTILLLFSITIFAVSSPISMFYKIMIIVFVASVYFIWTIWHHWEDHQLSTNTILEHLLITAVLIWLLFSLANA